MKPESWLKQEFGDEYFSGNLARLKSTIAELDLTPKHTKVITIGGTNGKGQTSRLLCEYLAANNHQYALWTSPHLTSVCERFHFNGQNIEEGELLLSFQATKKLLAKQIEVLSYFEFLFINFLSLTKLKYYDAIVLEVGLGGRLDACNSIDNDISGIVSISREHQRILGKTYAKILAEKLPIARRKLITSFELKYLRQKTEDYIRATHCEWRDLCSEGVIKSQDHFSTRNKLLALELYKTIFPDEKVVEINKTYAMRREVKLSSGVFHLYPSHNLDGFRKLFQFLRYEKYNNYDTLLISFSKRDWEDIWAICRLIKLNFGSEKIKLVPFTHFKSLEESQLAKIKSEFEFDIISLNDIFKEQSNSQFLVTGSNYFLGEFLHSVPSSK